MSQNQYVSLIKSNQNLKQWEFALRGIIFKTLKNCHLSNRFTNFRNKNANSEEGTKEH